MRRSRIGFTIDPRRRLVSGFTYIALMIFIAIIAVASAGTTLYAAMVQRRQAEEQLLFVGSEFKRALRHYAGATIQGSSVFPPTLESLLRDPRYPNPVRHLRQIYLDPITGRDDWVLVRAPDGGILAIHSASTEVPLKVAEFPQEFVLFEGKQSYAEWTFSDQ